MVKIVVVTKVVTHKQQTIQILHTTNQEKWPLCCRCNYCSNLIAEVEALVTAYREQARSISSIFLFFLIFSVINNQLSLFINDPCLIYLYFFFAGCRLLRGRRRRDGCVLGWEPPDDPQQVLPEVLSSSEESDCQETRVRVSQCSVHNICLPRSHILVSPCCYQVKAGNDPHIFWPCKWTYNQRIHKATYAHTLLSI